MDVSADAIFGAIVTLTLAALVGGWKLATMLAEVRGQVRPNGGQSLNDFARKAFEAAQASKLAAADVKDELTRYRHRQAEANEKATEARDAIAQDVSTIRAGQESLSRRIEVIEADRVQAAAAVGDALAETVDAAIEAEEKR